ncbi:MAG: hypothetical protein H7Y43_06610 [Akkermansiaceae bacterium]|nr:hypothetical protein [Verrucomicrobiales bacterium]
MRRNLLLLTLGLVLATAVGAIWWRLHAKRPPQVNASEYESDMTEGLVRGVLKELGGNAPSVCFLSFGEGRKPPSQAFVSRFATCRPEVRSAGSAVAPPIGKFFEISTGRRGLIIQVVEFRQIIPGCFEVVVAFSNLPAGRDHFIYRVVDEGGDWRVKSRTPV